MVVFNCNACGEALKKNQVEKHTLRCRSCEALSCVDCGKDFWGNDYQTHIKCITEDEKYCGKGYVPKVNKGEVKQEQWIEKVQNAIERSVSNPKLKGVLERLKDYPNIPRKKQKFENFLKNSLRVNSYPLITQVWDTLMAAAAQENGVQNGHKPADKAVNESVSHKLQTNDVQENGDTKGKKDKKKTDKKDKCKDENIGTTEMIREGKKRKLSEREETVEETTVAEVQDSSATQLHEVPSVGKHKLSKRERKEERSKKANKKEKKDKTESSNDNVERKGKKRKLSESEDPAQEETEVIATEKKKKKRRKSESKEEDDASFEQNNDDECKTPRDDEISVENDEDTTVTKKKKVKFNWEATILTVLKSKGEISLKKLQKKVICEFAAQDAANYAECNLTAKFNKKVNKMAKVKVFKDRVKLK
uniref:Uncharacterized protein n=2 Tax=Arion vulgaris TaxID=1028688 RepID=A0A0B6Z578_9EUPU